MILHRLLRGPRDGGWGDAPDDPLVARLETLAQMDAADVQARVERQQRALVAHFRQAHAASTVRPRARASLGFAPAFATALLLLALTAGGIAASTAGGPLYEVRLAAEEVFLPGSGYERAVAQLERLDRRVDEATAGAEARNPGAVAAALRAYERIVVELSSGQRPGDAQRASVATRLESQVHRLEQLRLGGSAVASVGAVDAARQTLRWLGGAGGRGGSQGQVPASISPGASPTPRAGPVDSGSAIPSGPPATSGDGPGSGNGGQPSAAPGSGGESGGPGGPSGDAESSARTRP